jgi:hypothetical protein
MRVKHRFVAAAAAVALGAVTLSGCGSSGGQSYGVFTDCSAIGPVTTTADVVSDLKPNIVVTDKGRVGVPDRPGADLVRVTVARARERLCADFRMAGSVSKPIVLLLNLTAKTQPGPSVGVAVDLPVGRRSSVSLKYPGADFAPNAGHVNAEVGVRGDQVSLVINRSAFPLVHLGGGGTSDWRRLVFDDFQWQALSIYIPSPRFPPSLEFIDADPAQQQCITYPEGQIVAGRC